MMTTALVSAALLIAVAQPIAQQSNPIGPMVRELASFRLSGPTFFTDGKIRGGSIGIDQWFFNQPIEFYQYSGKTLCMSGSATRTAPNDAGYGWRVSILPIRVTNAVELEVEWERKWERGTAVSGPRGRSRVSLQAGDKLMLDYIPAGAATPGCGAIGMGLQIEMLASAGEVAGEIVEADIWLVRKSNSETIERQTIRVRPGEPTPFYFKDLAIAIKGPLKVNNAYYFQTGPENALIVRTTGRLTPTLIRGERVTATIEISQGIKAFGNIDMASLATRPAQAGETTERVALYDLLLAKRGGATSEFTAVPSEVVEFQVPELSGGERLVIRVQMRVMK